MLAVLLARGRRRRMVVVRRERPIEVEIATVVARQAGTQAAVLNATGYVTARRRATVSSKITGKVVEVNIEEGMAVREGQVLARLDDETQRAGGGAGRSAGRGRTQKRQRKRGAPRRGADRRWSASTQARQASATRRRQRSTPRARPSTRSSARISAAREQVRVAERQVALERTNLDSTIIRAPFDGVVISKDAQPGEMVSPVSAGGGFTRTGIGTIVDMRSLEIEVDVNESYINRVKPDQGVTAVLDAYPDWQIPAHVITTVPSADRQKATVLVRIGFHGARSAHPARHGGQGDVPARERRQRQPAARPVTLVPKAAIKTEGKQSYVFVVVNDRVDRRAVTTGGTDGDRVEVMAGLNAGERVVVSPPAELSAGALVVTR